MNKTEFIYIYGGLLYLMDATWHPESHMLLEIYMSFGVDGNFDENMFFLIDHGDKNYSVYDSMDDVMTYLYNGDTKSRMFDLNYDEYESLGLAKGY